MPAVDSDMVCQLIGNFKRSGSQNIVRPVNILDQALNGNDKKINDKNISK